MPTTKTTSKDSVRRLVARMKKADRAKYKDGWDTSALEDQAGPSPEVIAAAFGFPVERDRIVRLTPEDRALVRASRISHSAGWLIHCIISASEDIGLTKSWGRHQIRRTRKDSPAEAELRILVKKALAVSDQIKKA